MAVMLSVDFAESVIPALRRKTEVRRDERATDRPSVFGPEV
jgi:hypothetical protein